MYLCKVLVSSLFISQCCNFFTLVSGFCCGVYSIPLCKVDTVFSGFHAAGFCLDCTAAYYPQFCSYDWCNIFGCNCGGDECRWGVCSQPCPYDTMFAKNGTNATLENKPTPSCQSIDTIMEQADRDKDGLLNMVEAFNWISQFNFIPKKKIKSDLEIVDKNKDGYISRQEIDKDAY